MKGVAKKTAAVLLSVIGVLIVFIGAYGIYISINDKPDNSGDAMRLAAPLGENGEAIGTPPLREDMLENALKSVVGISSADTSGGLSNTDTWYMGSGVLATEDGYIITNHHVIGARPQRIVVTLHDGKTIEGKTVWSNAALDLAVVKIE
ncbi:MAG: trypsin-like peptidase domain-containing protein, partial [Clostridia bacterium]|nr:trypsin-like peptidase domain-containing protein [Clostridia bacterium]